MHYYISGGNVTALYKLEDGGLIRDLWGDILDL